MAYITSIDVEDVKKEVAILKHLLVKMMTTFIFSWNSMKVVSFSIESLLEDITENALLPQIWCDASKSQTQELFVCKQEGNYTFESY